MPISYASKTGNPSLIPNIGPTTSYVPALNAAWGTNPTIHECKYAIVGDKYYIHGAITVGTSPAAGALTVGFPFAHTSQNTIRMPYGSATYGGGTDATHTVIVDPGAAHFGFNASSNWSAAQLTGTAVTAGLAVFFSCLVPMNQLIAGAILSQGVGINASSASLVSGASLGGDITAAQMTSQVNCVIEAGDVGKAKWSQANKVVYLELILNAITVTASSAFIQFTLPSSLPAPVSSAYTACVVYDNSGTVSSAGLLVIDNVRVVTLYKVGGNFTGGSNLTYVRSQIFYHTA